MEWMNGGDSNERRDDGFCFVVFFFWGGGRAAGSLQPIQVMHTYDYRYMLTTTALKQTQYAAIRR